MVSRYFYGFVALFLVALTSSAQPGSEDDSASCRSVLSTLTMLKDWHELKRDELLRSLSPNFVDRVKKLKAHKILGISQQASTEEIKMARKSLMLRVHQDFFPQASKMQQQLLRDLGAAINNAYDVMNLSSVLPVSGTTTTEQHAKDLQTYAEHFESMDVNSMSLQEFRQSVSGAEGHRNPTAFREARGDFTNKNLNLLLKKSEDFLDSFRLYSFIRSSEWSEALLPQPFLQKLRVQIESARELSSLYLVLVAPVSGGRLVEGAAEKLIPDVQNLAEKLGISEVDAIAEILRYRAREHKTFSLEVKQEFNQILFDRLAQIHNQAALDALFGMLIEAETLPENVQIWETLGDILDQSPELRTYAIQLFGRKHLKKLLGTRFTGLQVDNFGGTTIRDRVRVAINPGIPDRLHPASKLDKHLAEIRQLQKERRGFDEKYGETLASIVYSRVESYLKQKKVSLRRDARERLDLEIKLFELFKKSLNGEKPELTREEINLMLDQILYSSDFE